MRSKIMTAAWVKSGLAASVLLLASGTVAAQTVNLTAAPTSVTTPGGTVIPMWGYNCGAAVTGSTSTCSALNPNAPAAVGTTPAGWSPVVITVPYTGTAATTTSPATSTTSLTINLTNNLVFGSTASVPTSLTIVGQLGGGLGSTGASCLGSDGVTSHGAACVPSPTHAPASVTWSTVGTAPAFTPPPQDVRVRSFGTEVAAVAAGTGTATALTWSGLRPGTYLIESGTHPSIQGPMGLYGMLVVTAAPATATSAGTAYPATTTTATAITYNADVAMLLSEIDPVQNAAVAKAVATTGFNETTVWSGLPGGCGNPATTNSGNCYPPAVNYTPLFYMVNGVAFDKSHAGIAPFPSLFPTAPATGLTVATGTILVRVVNAGLRMHVPSIVGAQTSGVDGAGAAATVAGFTLVAEDGNPVPGAQGSGKPRVQSDVFMAAGKTYDLKINVPAASSPAIALYDRQLSLSGNAINRDAGMLAYIGANSAAMPATTATAAAVARADAYPSLVAGQTLTVSDPSKGVIANDTNVYGVTLVGTVPGLTLNSNGTFIYTAGTPVTFTYCANGTVTGTACSSNLTATVALTASTLADTITCTASTFTSAVSTFIAVKSPGVLANCTDTAHLPLTVVVPAAATAGMTLDINGGFSLVHAASAGTSTFAATVTNSHGQTTTANVTVTFSAPSNLAVTVLDGATKDTLNPITDYRWIIEEDKTFYVDPTKTTKQPCATGAIPGSAACPIVPTLGVNFHTSHMVVVAEGCTGVFSCETGQMVYNPDPAVLKAVPAACDQGNGKCRITATSKTPVLPSQVYLDPTKRYYISVLPGDAANPFYNASPTGHGMGGAPIGINPYCATQTPTANCQATAVTVLTQPTPLPPAKLSVFVFEDDFPLNGEHDASGAAVNLAGNDTLAPNEQGLGGFQIHLWDAFGGNGDFTGQVTTDMYNQPLTNSLDGTVDPLSGFNACPITAIGLANPGTNATLPLPPGGTPLNAAVTAGITGQIVTCPKYESDMKTLSPLAGQAVVANLFPGRWGVIVTPGADHIARGEEWLQTNTLDGQKAHDAFTRIGEPSYFQEFGPASFHVTVGFANPAIINARLPGVCHGTDINVNTGTPNACANSLTGRVVGEHLSRTPDERLYGSGSHDAFSWTQCFVSVGDPDGEDFAFAKCDADGYFSLTGLPDGDWRITTFDQWNDQLVDGLSTPVRLGGTPVCPGAASSATVCNMGDIAATQWQTNLYTRTFIDDAKTGLSASTDTGIPFLNVGVRLRDGSIENNGITDFTGTVNFNETFPLFSWYTVESDVTRYKNTGIHVVYDAGGPTDGSTACGITGYPPCGTSTIGHFLANTAEQVSLPTNLRVPGAIYCAGADCANKSMVGGTASDPPSACTTTPANTTTHTPAITSCSTLLSTGRIDPPWVGTEGWQGFPGQQNFLEFGKEPYIAGENGGIKGHVVYASTRPFDDPQFLVQTAWEPLVPNVTVNLYQEGFAADGVTPTMTLVDHTTTTSFDDFAQGFRADGVTPNMNCPGQSAATGVNPDLFFYSIQNQPDYLNLYNAQHVTPGVLTAATGTPLPANSQYKCYDGMHNWNQIQPVPYDGQYKFPSVTATNAAGKPTASNCSICSPDPVPAPDLYAGIPMLPAGKFVVEVVVPPGYELVKEEDKNILIGDNFISPVAQEFGGLGNVFILPDQASVAGTFGSGAGYNANNPSNSTQSLGTTPSNNIVPGFVPEPTWPCVGEARIVPQYISLFPQSLQVAPFAGALRNLCDRKEVTLGDQMGAIAKFFIYSSTHIAAKFTGGITDDYTSEFDPFSPQFGEKFAPPDLPVSVKDWAGNEILRTYADHWGSYDGMMYSTWEVNAPNPTGYGPQVAVMCMNDPGPIKDVNALSPTVGQMITDPAFTQGYSQFCYEIPFMPGATAYLDTPVVPTSAFAGAGYNNVDCAYPTLTPAIKEVDGDQVGPWVSASGAGHTLTITALGDQMVPNNAYSGPSATAAPFNAKTILRHYGFGGTAGTVALVGSDGVSRPLTNVGWGDLAITGTVPAGLPNCAVQQQATYAGTAATSTQCGELMITSSTGLRSIDSVTVTVGGNAPFHVNASGTNSSIQAAIDAANPGDLIMVDPTCAAGTCANGTGVSNGTANHNELVLMWKPVRLQGVGPTLSVINANTHPAGKMDPWRRQVVCLFGLAINGQPVSGVNGYTNPNTPANPYDPANDTANNGNPYTCPANELFAIDRLPLEAVVGWDANVNGNLAEQLQEPSLMGALEGAGVTVLAKGVKFLAGTDPFGSGLATPASFPPGTLLLSASDCLSGTGVSATNPYPSNFFCNPSTIDGMGITGGSQGGGGIFVHGWGHNIQIANNRIYNNSGTLGGGINMGQGEFAPSYLQGSAINASPGSCETSTINGTQLPYCQNLNTNVHNNYVSLNSATGDELFSATPAGAGGVNFVTGADYYKFSYNWVCGNLSSGDGGGFGHLGFSKNGDIEHNTFMFNQSLNPTIPANGGAMIIMGTPDADPTCGLANDADCISIPGTLGPTDGIGPGLVINANLILGNAAEAGSGGGIAFQNVNGSDVIAFPKAPLNWYHVLVTNNIIANNVAGWDGGGVSMLDALNIDLVNNTIVNNSTTASAGVLFNTLGAPLASTQPDCPFPNAVDLLTNICKTPAGTPYTHGVGQNSTTSAAQPAGVVAIQNSAVLKANIDQLPGATLAAKISCPTDHTASGSTTTCEAFSYPMLANNIIYQNAAFQIGVGALSNDFQQNVVSIYNASFAGTAPTVLPSSQTYTGQCFSNSSYWDVGVRGDTGPGNHSSTLTLNPLYTVFSADSNGQYGAGANNFAANTTFVKQYCDGSRQPPEFGLSGWAVPAGIADAQVPNPLFALTPVATVDEGNNWINLRWGPLSSTAPTTAGPNTAGALLANYAPSTGSAIDLVPSTQPHPSTDFFGNLRPDPTNLSHFDAGAIEVGSTMLIVGYSTSPASMGFGSAGVTNPGTQSATQTLTVTNSSNVGMFSVGVTFSGNPTQYARSTANPGTCGISAGTAATPVNPGASCTYGVVFAPTATGSAPATATVSGTIAGATYTLGTVRLTGTGDTASRSATLAPAAHNYGNVVRGTLALFAPPQVYTLLNTGNLPLTVGARTVTGTNPGDFPINAVLSTCGTTQGTLSVNTGTATAPSTGSFCVITEQFAPLAADTLGAKAATLNAPVTGVAPTPTAALSGTTTGATLTFTGPTPSLVTGATTTHTGLVTVTNAATATGSFTFTAAPGIAKITGPATGAFSILTTGTTITRCAFLTALAPGGSCQINVQYAPGGSTTAATATVTVTGIGLATATAADAGIAAN